MELSKDTRKYLSDIGRKGGQKKSEKKRKASKENWKKALAAIKGEINARSR